VGRELTHYDRIIKDITSYVSTQQCKATAIKADSMRVFALQAKDPKLLDKDIEVKFRAQLRGGQILIEMERAGERRASTAGRPKKGSSQKPLSKLSDLKVTKTESFRWRALANMPPQQRDVRLKTAQRKARAAVDGMAKQVRAELLAADEERVKALAPVAGRFKTVVIDPPWDDDGLSDQAKAGLGYATMTHEQLMMLKVQKVCEADAHCYLWVTNNFITRGVELMEQYGFQHKTVLTWRKTTRNGKLHFGLGRYFRNATEHVLFGVRGELRTRVDNVRTIFDAPVGEHSEKPEEFYEIVRKASHLPAVEFFQRRPRPGFVNAFEVKAPTLEAAE